ncbi:MAG: orotidine-5'-phosphate decarboxylase [Flavobacteriaceae bacterium]|nr:orotidine-5'-phosphate decarboxylase [Flavobacteriaceae bacterium]|tara:strand:- start:37755 stop:38582 length:828 start_codon:yes stop_codon:yes gene_type:complete
MKIENLINQIKQKKSFLCVGLDVDLDKIPKHLHKHEDPIFEFSKAIIDSTSPFAIAYKPNLAFFESYGLKGWNSLEKIINYINSNHPEIFTIADAKRGDIGNTSSKYARTFFETLNFDSITVNPYMGRDSIEPFLEYDNKYTILLSLTSNSGSSDFQFQLNNGKPLYLSIIKKSLSWKNKENLMYVIGATKAESLKEVREIIPNSFLLVPGIGAQGGSLSDVCRFGLNENCGLIVNSSRQIIYSDNSIDYAKKSAEISSLIQREMSEQLLKKGII